MHGLKFLLPIGAVLVLSFATNNEVNAAPHPCLWMLDFEPKRHESPPTTAKPEVVEVFSSPDESKTNQLEKLIWGPSSSGKQNSKSTIERMISSYVKFLANAFMF